MSRDEKAIMVQRKFALHGPFKKVDLSALQSAIDFADSAITLSAGFSTDEVIARQQSTLKETRFIIEQPLTVLHTRSSRAMGYLSEAQARMVIDAAPDVNFISKEMVAMAKIQH